MGGFTPKQYQENRASGYIGAPGGTLGAMGHPSVTADYIRYNITDIIRSVPERGNSLSYALRRAAKQQDKTATEPLQNRYAHDGPRTRYTGRWRVQFQSAKRISAVSNARLYYNLAHYLCFNPPSGLVLFRTEQGYNVTLRIISVSIRQAD